MLSSIYYGYATQPGDWPLLLWLMKKKIWRYCALPKCIASNGIFCTGSHLHVCSLWCPYHLAAKQMTRFLQLWQSWIKNNLIWLHQTNSISQALLTKHIKCKIGLTSGHKTKLCFMTNDHWGLELSIGSIGLWDVYGTFSWCIRLKLLPDEQWNKYSVCGKKSALRFTIYLVNICKFRNWKTIYVIHIWCTIISMRFTYLFQYWCII